MKDLVIIGGGPGGTAAAERAAKLGWSVVLIERDSLGGTCLNRGCIPTKVLFREAELIGTLKHIDQYGIELDGYRLNFDKIRERKNGIVRKLREGLEKQMKLCKAEVVYGEGQIIDTNRVQVTSTDGAIQEIEAKYILIATGSKTILPPIPGLALPGVVTSDELMALPDGLESLVIVGGGVIGLEWAVIYQALGVQVSVVELQEDVLMIADKDIRKRLSVYLKQKGIQLYTKHEITAFSQEKDQLLVHCRTEKGEKQLKADLVLMAIGRKADWGALALESAGIETDRRGIVTDENLKTSVDNIYAIGDVTGKCLLAHTAHHHGILAVEAMAGQVGKLNYQAIPSCVFILPEYAKVGLTEEEAAAKGISYRAGKAFFLGNGKALALGETDGYVKILVDEQDTILGVQILGPHASDLIHEGVLAVNHGMKLSEITESVHAHPTLAETLYEAAMRVEPIQK